MKKKRYIFWVLLLITATAVAQNKPKPRSYLQQLYLSKAFIMPEVKKGGLKITRASQIDSVFKLWENGWRSVAADSLAKHPSLLTLAEFSNLDAYCYFWGLASFTQNLGVGDDYGDILISKYMIPSLRRDLATIKRLVVPEIIQRVDLANTLAIGSAPAITRETFLQTYALYQDFREVYLDLAQRPDTLVSGAAKKVLPTLDRMFYVMNARYNFYQKDQDKAFTYLVTGLNIDKYSKTRAIDLAKKLNAEYVRLGEKEKALAILNTLAIHTTPDNLNRDTLAAWYAAIDAVAGPKAYVDVKSKLSSSSFKAGAKQLKLPANWSFLTEEIPTDRLKNAKYILLDFWYTGCGPCLAEIPELNQFYEGLKGRNDVIFISVNTDYENGKQASAFVAARIKELGIRFPVYYDGGTEALNKQAGIISYPSKMIIDMQGRQLVKTDGSAITTDGFTQFLKEIK